MQDDESVDREEHDHGTDEYVSDCNRLPFAGQGSGRGRSGCLVLALAWAAAAAVVLASQAK